MTELQSETIKLGDLVIVADNYKNFWHDRSYRFFIGKIFKVNKIYYNYGGTLCFNFDENTGSGIHGKWLRKIINCPEYLK